MSGTRMTNKQLVALTSGWISLLIAVCSIIGSIKFDISYPIGLGVTMLLLVAMFTFMAIDGVED
jgi:hypothetical protein